MSSTTLFYVRIKSDVLVKGNLQIFRTKEGVVLLMCRLVLIKCQLTHVVYPYKYFGLNMKYERCDVPRTEMEGGLDVGHFDSLPETKSRFHFIKFKLVRKTYNQDVNRKKDSSHDAFHFRFFRYTIDTSSWYFQNTEIKYGTKNDTTRSCKK